MLKPFKDKKGIALFMVLGTLLVVVILTNVILTLILNQARLTHHQVSRIQAYYASLAGMNYALEMLRNGTWVAGTNCIAGSPCSLSLAADDFNPATIQSVSIVIKQAGSANCPSPPAPSGGACISITTDYTPPTT